MAREVINGYMGKILRVDLSSGSVTEEFPRKELYHTYIGGTGLGAKYLFDEVPPSVSWSDPENRMAFFTGPLSGTKVNGSGTFSVSTKGACTNLFGVSQANGYFGAFLRLCGYDGVIVQGKSEKWKYLHIQDGKAELVDASPLVGKDTWDTLEIIQKNIGKQCSVFCIGPAAENLVRFTGIVGDHGHVAAHNGLGAVMGSKRLKAIVAERGKSVIPLADPEKLAKVAVEMIESAMKLDPNLSAYGTSWAFEHMVKGSIVPVKNYTTSTFPDAPKFTGMYLREHFETTKSSCWACRLAHTRMTKVTEGPYKGAFGDEPEYEGLVATGSVIGQTDPGASVMLGNLIDRLGFDINETGYVMGWLMECYDKGYLTQKDLDGIDLKWGDAEATKEMLLRIARREGNGNIWAEGVKRAAEKIGGEAQKCAVYTMKGATPRGHDHRARWSELIDTCLSNTGTIEAGGGVPHPEQIGVAPLTQPFDHIAVSTYNAKTNGRRQFEDSLGICYLAAQDINLTIQAFNAATGLNFTVQDALHTGFRIINLMRVFNYRHGLTKDMEAPSERYSSSPVDGIAKGTFIRPLWDDLRKNYYTLMEWDPETGKPTKETLEKYGLGDLYGELAKTK
jgi:aldehyde:ferredoxin oxidoreductase